MNHNTPYYQEPYCQLYTYPYIPGPIPLHTGAYTLDQGPLMLLNDMLYMHIS